MTIPHLNKGKRSWKSVVTPGRAHVIAPFVALFLFLAAVRTAPLTTSPLAKAYHPSCVWTYEREQGGYAPVANDGRHDLAEFICPSMFRDMSDYVYAWPYDHFGEHDVWVGDPALAAQNLPPVCTIHLSCIAVSYASGDLFTNFCVRISLLRSTPCTRAHEFIGSNSLLAQ